MVYEESTVRLTSMVLAQAHPNKTYGKFDIINEFRCYEAKIEESEKAGSHRESNPGHLWLEPPVLCH